MPSLLLEDGSNILLEDDSGSVLLEGSSTPPVLVLLKMYRENLRWSVTAFRKWHALERGKEY